MTSFSPARALVTGAGGRLGRAMATALGGRGLAVAIHYNASRQGAEETAQQVIAAGGKAVLVKADLAREADTSNLVQRAAESLGGPIDCLVNNASVFEDDTAQTHSRADWDLHMDVNLRAPIVLSQAMAANLGAGVRGLIINMIDQRVFRTTPTFFSYTLSKHALWTATRTLAQSLAPDIRVNGIGPGPTLQNARQSADDFKRQRAATLTGEGANPEEIVRALLYLMDASAVTGQMIAVDGGQHLVWQTPDIVGLVE